MAKKLDCGCDVRNIRFQDGRLKADLDCVCQEEVEVSEVKVEEAEEEAPCLSCIAP